MKLLKLKDKEVVELFLFILLLPILAVAKKITVEVVLNFFSVYFIIAHSWQLL